MKLCKQLGTVVSAYGCWQLFNNDKPHVENGARAEILKRDTEEALCTSLIAYQEKETKVSIKLQSRYAEEELQQRAGFWGYLMQTTYQVGQTSNASGSMFPPECSNENCYLMMSVLEWVLPDMLDD